MSGYLAAFLLTLAVEVPLYTLALRALLEVPPQRGWVEALLANSTSHPLAFLLLFPRTDESFAARAAVEAFVVAWEAGLLRARLGRDLPVLVGLSFLVNAASLGLGALLVR